MIIGDAIAWLMSWVAIFYICRKHRPNSNQILSEQDLVESLQESRLTLKKETIPISNQGKCGEAPKSSSPLNLELQLEMLKQSLEAVNKQLGEIKQSKLVQELKHRETRRRLEEVEKYTHSRFFN